MLKNWLKGTTALIAVGSIMTPGFVAYAQQTDQSAQADDTEAVSEIEEITVTARRRNESMQDVPISMMAVNRLTLDQSGYNSLGDVSFGVPNFNFNNRGSILGSFGIRGIATNVSNPGVESALAVYVDGVLIGRPQAFDYILASVEQVEVLRGPQGTLFGKNTISGALNITTQRPTDEFEGKMKFETGRFERGAASMMVNIPISDKLAVRISGSVENQQGWIRNLFDDRRFNGEDNWSGRVQVLMHPSDQTEVYWTIDRFFDDRNFVAQINNDPAALKDNPGVNLAKGIVDIDAPSTSKRSLWGTSLEINHDTDSGYNVTFIGAFRQTNFQSEFDGDTQRQALSDTRETDNTDQYTAELRVSSPEGNALEWTAGVYYLKQQIDSSTETRFFPKNILAGCNAPVSPNFFRGALGKGQFFQTSRLVGFDDAGLPVWEFDFDNDGIFGETAPVTTPPGGGGFTVSENIGCTNPDLIAFSRHIPGGNAEDLFLPQFDGLTTVDDVPAVDGVREFGKVNTRSVAVFAHANYHLTDQLTLSGGARHTWEHKFADLTQIGKINIVRPSFTTMRSRTDKEWSGTASLSYQVTDDIIPYLKFAHGFKSGGFQFDITQGENASSFNVLATKSPFIPKFLKSNPGATKQDVINALIAASADPNKAPANIEFGTENVNVYEIGVKTTLFNRKLRFNIAAFSTDYNNIQQNILNLDTGIIVLNVPGARVRGFEIDMTAKPTPEWTIEGGVGTAYSSIRKSLVIPSPDPTAPPLVDTSGFLGLRLAQAPEVTANAAITYAKAVSDTGQIVIRGEWSYQGSIFHELDPNPAQRAKVFEPSFSLFNGRIGYVDEENDWDIFFWGKNIFNKRYAAFRRANPIIRNFGIPIGGAGNNLPPNRFPGSATGQAIFGQPRTWGLTVQKHF